MIPWSVPSYFYDARDALAIVMKLFFISTTNLRLTSFPGLHTELLLLAV